MTTRIATIFAATAAIACAVMSALFWVVCTTTGHSALEACLVFTTSIVLSIGFGIEGALWLGNRKSGRK